MRKFLAAIFLFFVSGTANPAPPDPMQEETEVMEEVEEMEPEMPTDTIILPELLEETMRDLKDIEGLDRRALKDLEKKLLILKKKYEGMERVLKGIDEGYWIDELILCGDSVFIRLNNDSSFTFRYEEGPDPLGSSKNDIVHFGGNIVIEEDEVIEGDVVSAFGDVEVRGTVEGGVIAFSGDIYISSTGNVKGGVLALSGKVKQEQGSKVGPVMWGSSYSRDRLEESERTVFRVMGSIFFVLFIIWIILSATCASLLKSNVKTVIRHIGEDGIIKSFFVGYLAYFLALIIFIGLCITVLGLPLAILGVPLAVVAAAILSSTAISNIVGAKILNSGEYTIRTFFYGNLFLGPVPGLLFLVQLITGNLAIMVLSWIVIGIFIFIVLPVGLGAVLSTRFGTRPKKTLPAESAPNIQG